MARKSTPQEAADLRAQGLTTPQIATRLGVSVGTVKIRLRKAGALFGWRENGALATVERVAKLRAQGLTRRQISEQLGVAMSIISLRLKAAGLVLTQPGRVTRTEITADLVLQMLSRGMTVNEVAVKLECSPGLVRRRLARTPPA